MMLEISVAILTTCPKYDVETFHGHFEDVGIMTLEISMPFCEYETITVLPILLPIFSPGIW